ncbi:hypothetical protein MSP7336_01127 [Mycobacterium shimoidei]|uniref:Uncharacterized protein n=1 Tax=Mycobacterium shimoidei TaxID=29313 RepID=A0A375YVJ6_MYCSH|nr:hypothetical protein MSP7336_01127 [Mycobacterium shimoidei]
MAQRNCHEKVHSPYLWTASVQLTTVELQHYHWRSGLARSAELLVAELKIWRWRVAVACMPLERYPQR